MRGRIQDFSLKRRQGVIAGDDGEEYSFVLDEWKSENRPAKGDYVDFDVHDAQAFGIYLVPTVSKAMGGADEGLSAAFSSNRVPAAILALLFGGMGFHKFFLGYHKQGVIMLLCSMVGWLLFFVPNLILMGIAFAEFAIYLSKSDREFERVYVKGHRPWF